jgi:hypothetical protein
VQVEPVEQARRVYSILSHAKPLVQGAKPKRVVLAPEGEPAAGEPAATSWCKGLEMGNVKPSTMSEGPKQRKKRKRMEGGQVQPQSLATIFLKCPQGCAYPLRAIMRKVGESGNS